MNTNVLLMSLVPDEGLVLILGGIGSGKSALAYAIAEDKYHLTGKPVFVFGFPSEKAHLLPDFIEPIYDLDLPEKSIIILDEAYIQFHSRSSSSKVNRFMDMFTGLVRQKEILALFITQTARKADIGIVSSAQLVLIKEPTMSQIKLDRSSLREILKDAFHEFGKVEDPHRCTFAMGGRFYGMIRESNKLPSFWSDELSKAWKGVSLEEALGQKRSPGDSEERPFGQCKRCGKIAYIDENGICSYCRGVEKRRQTIFNKKLAYLTKRRDR